jgi:cobalt-zinc-cadmium efflux system protein
MASWVAVNDYEGRMLCERTGQTLAEMSKSHLEGIVVTLAVMIGTWDLFRESVDLALDAVPRGIELEAVSALLAALPGVSEVHDLHVWNASTSEISLTAHLVAADGCNRDALLAAAHALVRERFRIAHATLQIESAAAGCTCPQRPSEAL